MTDETKVPQLDRMLHFHTSPGSLDLALRARHIRQFQRNPQNKLKVVVVTDLMGPQGPMGYEVDEGFAYCVEIYTAALENRQIDITLSPNTRHTPGGLIKP